MFVLKTKLYQANVKNYFYKVALFVEGKISLEDQKLA